MSEVIKRQKCDVVLKEITVTRIGRRNDHINRPLSVTLNGSY